MSRGVGYTLYQIALAVWNQIPVASRTVTVTTNSDKGTTPGTVKLIQRGTIALGTNESSHDSTIATVDTAKAIIIPLGATTPSSGGVDLACRLTFSSLTLVTAIRDLTSTGGAAAPATVGYQVVEYY